MEFVMNIILSSVRMATPLIFLALAELYSQRRAWSTSDWRAWPLSALWWAFW
mgnify:CR=1 FL=1